MPHQRHGGARNCQGRLPLPSGAVSPAEPVTGLMVAKAQPLPARRRLSSGLSGALKPDGRRRKIESAVLLTAMRNQLVTTLINQPLQFRPEGPGGRGWSVGATGFQVRLRVLPERGTCFVILLGVGLTGLLLSVVTNMFCPPLVGGSYLNLLILSGAVACGRCKRRH